MHSLVNLGTPGSSPSAYAVTEVGQAGTIPLMEVMTTLKMKVAKLIVVKKRAGKRAMKNTVSKTKTTAMEQKAQERARRYTSKCHHLRQ